MADGFKAARDFLLAHRTDYRTAYRDFRWPELDRSNWALDFYGQTETTSQIGNPPGVAVKPGSMGLPLPGYRIRTVDADGREAGEGELCIELEPRPAGLMLGYQQEDGGFAPLGTTAYRTGDVAMRDAEGYLTVVGRADEVFKAADYRISPFELESAPIELAAVAERRSFRRPIRPEPPCPRHMSP